MMTKIESHSWVLEMEFHTSQHKKNMFSRKSPLNNSPVAIGDFWVQIKQSIFSYFLWPKSNKKTCRKKAIFASQNHGWFSASMALHDNLVWKTCSALIHWKPQITAIAGFSTLLDCTSCHTANNKIAFYTVVIKGKIFD